MRRRWFVWPFCVSHRPYVCTCHSLPPADHQSQTVFICNLAQRPPSSTTAAIGSRGQTAAAGRPNDRPTAKGGVREIDWWEAVMRRRVGAAAARCTVALARSRLRPAAPSYCDVHVNCAREARVVVGTLRSRAVCCLLAVGGWPISGPPLAEASAGQYSSEWIR